MWVMTPLFGIVLGIVLNLVIGLGYIWLPKVRKSDEKYYNPFVTIIRGGFFASFTYYGILFWDTVIKVGFLGILSLGNITFLIGTLILLALFGTLLIFGSVFVAPTWKSLVSFIGILIFSLYYFEVQQLDFPSSEDGFFYEPLLFCWFIAAASCAIGVFVDNLLILKVKKKGLNKKLIKPLWDISTKFKKFYYPKGMIVFWLLFSIELILEFEGIAMLYWI